MDVLKMTNNYMDGLIDDINRLQDKNERYRQALNRVLGFVTDCPRYHGLRDGLENCSCENDDMECNKCWKIALGVEE